VSRPAVVLALNPAQVAVQVTVGETAHSLAVFAAGSDYLLDAAGVSVRGPVPCDAWPDRRSWLYTTRSGLWPEEATGGVGGAE
jgi:hypothetical protein